MKKEKYHSYISHGDRNWNVFDFWRCNKKNSLHFIFGTDKVRIDLVDEAQTNGYVVPGQVRDIDMEGTEFKCQC